MCIVAIAWQILADLPLVLISNRDEFYAREALPLQHWADGVVMAGQDVPSQGTWLGTTPNGRWAVLTNFRDANDREHYSSSRGHIIHDFLHSDLSPMRFAQGLAQPAAQQRYAGYNLICGDLNQAVYSSNRGAAPQLLANGVYVLSNGLLSDHWAKCEHLRQRFNQELLPRLQMLPQKTSSNLANLLPNVWNLLEDERKRPDESLPNTGVGLEMERLLSSTFIASPIYGTRCSNFLALSPKQILWWEKTQQGKFKDDVVALARQLV